MTMKKLNGTAPQPPKTPGPPVNFIDLDDQDRALLQPLVAEVTAGKRAERMIDQIVGVIKRRTGIRGETRTIIDANCRRILVVPTDETK
jgi:hypothetical protein